MEMMTRKAPLTLIAAALLAGACDIPTGLPRFEPRFLLPLDRTSVSVAQLLPAGLAADGATFRLDLPAVTILRTLGQMCGAACLPLQGRTAPKPAFSYAFTTTHVLPGDVLTASLTAGAVQFSATHDLGFDPLRPAGAVEGGQLRITVRSGLRELGSLVISEPFPSGTTLTRTVALASGDISGSVEVEVSLASPAGSSTRIDNTSSLTVTITPTGLPVGEASIVVRDRPISMEPLVVDLSHLEDDLRYRARGGALVLTVENPFAVSGELELRLQAPGSGADYRKPVQLVPGQSTVRVPLTGEELSWLLGFEVTVTLTGPVGSGGSPVTVQPGQEARVGTRLELVLGIGG
jgi:hypothetical protein